MEYIPRLYDFLDGLSRNNDRPWFQAHKDTYDELRLAWLADVDRMISLMAAWDPRLSGCEGRKAMYRIYRDTRFSLDKTPYKTHFAAALSPMGLRDRGAGYYIQLGTGKQVDSGLYGGIWCPPMPELTKLRRAIADNIEEFEEITSDKKMLCYFPDWVGDTLKTVPKGWDRNHPLAALLRRKDYGREHPVGRDFYMDPSWPEKAAEIFHTIAPLVEFINYSLYEE